MEQKDVLITEVGAALAILGLLLVFLPLLVERTAARITVSTTQQERRRWIRLTWTQPLLVGLAATDATVGLLTLWGCVHAAALTGWLLIALIWAVAGVSFVIVKMGT